MEDFINQLYKIERMVYLLESIRIVNLLAVLVKLLQQH